MAILIKATGFQTEVQPQNGEAFSLEELQRFVGGYIEMVCLRNGLILWVNEEGKLHHLPPNVRATQIAQGSAIYPFQDDYIVGDVLMATLTESGEDPREEGGS